MNNNDYNFNERGNQAGNKNPSTNQKGRAEIKSGNKINPTQSGQKGAQQANRGGKSGAGFAGNK